MPELPDLVENPYEPPRAVDPPEETFESLRRKARWNLRVSILVLLPPAIANWYCLFFVPWNGASIPYGQARMSLLALFELLVISGIAWIGLYSTLDSLARGLCWLAGQLPAWQAWKECLCRSVWPAPRAAFVGSAIWFLWLYLFFLKPGDHKLWVTVVLGVIGHLLGAWVYGNILLHLFLLWRKLRPASGSIAPTQLPN